MKFGLMQLVSGGGGRTESEVYRDNLEIACMAEDLGFDSLWVAEHHFTDYGLVANIMQYLTAVAVKTERIRLGAAVVVTPLHNPIRIAEEASFLDVISNGRLDLGVGRGYQPREFAAFGQSMDESRGRFDESIAFLRKAWESVEPFDWDGEFFSGQQIAILPRPIQNPHPPLWLACVSPTTFDMGGEKGWRIMTSPNFTPLNIVKDNFARYSVALTAHDPANFNFPIMQQVYVGETDEAAYDEPQESCMAYFQKLGSLLPQEVKGEASGGQSYEQFRKTKRKMSDLRYDYLFENGVTFGSTKRVIERLQFLQEEVNLDYFLGWFNFGTMPQAMAKASLQRFAEEVMPIFVD